MLDIAGIDNEEAAVAGYEAMLDVTNKIPTEKSKPERALQLPIQGRYTQRKLSQEDGAHEGHNSARRGGQGKVGLLNMLNDI